MSKSRKSFNREAFDTRRSELIDATLRLIASKGIRAATARAISAEAGVTPGLIRHYFASKDELLIAAYEDHMTALIAQSAQASSGEFATAKDHLINFIVASLSPPVTDPKGVALWAGFFQMLLHDEAMRKSHIKTYSLLRRHIEELISSVFEEENRQVSEAELRQLSLSCNGLLDGLWIEGSAIGDSFEDGELVAAGLKALGGILQLDLSAGNAPAAKAD